VAAAKLEASDRLLAERDSRITELQVALAEARKSWWRRLLG
jgi:hypothetical protein